MNIQVSDGWETVPQENDSGLIRGKILKFREGGYVLDKQYVANGTSFVVTGVAVAWVKWGSGKPQEHRVTQPGQQHLSRDQLPDLDPEGWETGLNGEPADPWRDTRYVYLEDRESADEATFTSDSVGGRLAVGELRNQIVRFRTTHRGARPIVELAVGKMKTKVGMRTRPHFKVTGWDRGDEPPIIEQQLSPTDVPDDDIPY